MVHLGDIYYTGEEYEVTERFLDPWPVKKNHPEQQHSWCLNGNHDMYCGGHGYFNLVLGDPRFSGQHDSKGKGVSYFRLSNENWQIFGLDTAWDQSQFPYIGRDGYLEGRQAEWVSDCIGKNPDSKPLLLSHHQPTNDDGTPKGDLLAKLEPAIQAGGIEGWFWGHDHACKAFAQKQDIRYSACVGNGAMPEPVSEGEPTDVEWEYNEGHPDDRDRMFRFCGFSILDFDGDALDVTYWNENGDEVGKKASLPVGSR